MSEKNELRKELLLKRRKLHSKYLDESVANILIKTDIFKNAKTILLYASLDDEISTDFLIECALNCEKRVALPVCIDKNGNMDFYYINSFDDLVTGHFSVREPDINKCGIVTDYSNSICIVPAISYDERGYRLGYGKGYYDRFLQKYTSISVGLCYNELVKKELPINSFDIPVDYIVTQSRIISVGFEEDNNG